MSEAAALSIDSLQLAINGTTILNGVNLTVAPGEIVGLVGRSGSGKSMTSLAATGLAPETSMVTGMVSIAGAQATINDDQDMRARRGRDIALIFQEPATALNPVQMIGKQIAEVFRIHTNISERDAMDNATQLLARVGLDPEQIPPTRYPHELSGGQRQRVMIAMAIALEPTVLIADEPTTALDATTQAEILALLKKLVRDSNIALLLITHDLSVIAEYADRVCVVADGVTQPSKPIAAFVENNRPALIERTQERAKSNAQEPPILNVQSITCEYRSRPNIFANEQIHRAVDNVSFSLRRNENIALIGQSGCGKSTLARAIMGLHPLQSGSVSYTHLTLPTIYSV